MERWALGWTKVGKKKEKKKEREKEKTKKIEKSRDLFRIYTKNVEGLYAENSSWLFSRLNSRIPPAGFPRLSHHLYVFPVSLSLSLSSHSFFLTCPLCTFRDSRRYTVSRVDVSLRITPPPSLTLCVFFFSLFLPVSLIKRRGATKRCTTEEMDSGIRVVSSGDKRYFLFDETFRWDELALLRFDVFLLLPFPPFW